MQCSGAKRKHRTPPFTVPHEPVLHNPYFSRCAERDTCCADQSARQGAAAADRPLENQVSVHRIVWPTREIQNDSHHDPVALNVFNGKRGRGERLATRRKGHEIIFVFIPCPKFQRSLLCKSPKRATRWRSRISSRPREAPQCGS